MLRYNVCFLRGNTLIGAHWEFPDAEQVIRLIGISELPVQRHSVGAADAEGAQTRLS
jgi:hypothetical protein